MSRGFPAFVVPMQPTLAEPFHRDGWVYEEKYDGWRIVAYKQDGHVRLISRSGRDHTARFAAIAAAVAELPERALVLDGEICVFDESLVSHFNLLGREGRTAVTTPPMFAVFDCLFARGRDLRWSSLHVRREQLEAVIDGAALLFPARRLPDHGHAAWDVVKDRGYEGLVGKDPSASYREGLTRAWRKVKIRRDAVFVIGGLALAGERVRGLLVGEGEGRRLICRGLVEFGVRRWVIDALVAAARGLGRDRSPFHGYTDTDALWLQPRLRCEISYAEVMDGWLRDPVFRRLV